MMKRRVFVTLSFLSVVAFMLAAKPVVAHHALQAEFDTAKRGGFTGVLTKFSMINPHVRWVARRARRERRPRQVGSDWRGPAGAARERHDTHLQSGRDAESHLCAGPRRIESRTRRDLHVSGRTSDHAVPRGSEQPERSLIGVGALSGSISPAAAGQQLQRLVRQLAVTLGLPHGSDAPHGGTGDDRRSQCRPRFANPRRGRALPIDALRPVFRIMSIGFVINASTGLVLFVSEAADKGTLWVFYVKLSFIALALVTAFRTRRLIFGADGATTVGEIPGSAKALAILSMVLWTGAIFAGRLMAYVH